MKGQRKLGKLTGALRISKENIKRSKELSRWQILDKKSVRNMQTNPKQVQVQKHQETTEKPKRRPIRNIHLIDKDRGKHRRFHRKESGPGGTHQYKAGKHSEKDRSMKWHKMHKERITIQNWKYKPETLIYNTESSKQRSINYKFGMITWELTHGF